MPDTFEHLEDTVRALKSKGFKVSVDSANKDELIREPTRVLTSY